MTGPRRRERVFLVGYYGKDNLGDEAIRLAIEAEAEAVGVTIAAVAIRPGRSPRRGEVLLDWRHAVGYVRAITSADRVVLGGGGILKDEGLRLIFDLAVTAALARLIGRRVALLSVGVGPLYTRLGRWLVWLTARLAQVRTVRDESSAAMLRGLGIEGVIVGADPVFRFQPAADRPSGERRPIVLVAARRWFIRQRNGDARQEVLREHIAQGIRPLINAGWGVALASLYWPRDRDEAIALRAHLPADAPVAVDNGPLDWHGLVERVSRAGLVVAMRYHGLAAAAVAGCPVVALAYEPKVTALAADLGVPIFDVHDGDLGTSLAGYIQAWLEAQHEVPQAGGEYTLGPGVPEPHMLGELRARARAALAAALLG